ncbi:MAG: DUF4388 domain-containing protein, partial [Candidatus Aminicenantales bacterium]
MDESLLRGNLSRTPFVRVLAGLWRDERTGTLSVHGPGGPKSFIFENGSLTVDRAAFPEKDFLKILLTSGTADLISLTRAEEHAQRNRVPVLRAILEVAVLDPGRLWALIEQFTREEVFSLFDRDDGEFEFEPGAPLP